MKRIYEEKLIQNNSTGCNRIKQRLKRSNTVSFKYFKSIKKHLFWLKLIYYQTFSKTWKKFWKSGEYLPKTSGNPDFITILFKFMLRSGDCNYYCLYVVFYNL